MGAATHYPGVTGRCKADVRSLGLGVAGDRSPYVISPPWPEF